MGQIYSITVEDIFYKGSKGTMPVKLKSRYPVHKDKAGFVYLYTGKIVQSTYYTIYFTDVFILYRGRSEGGKV